MTTLHITPGVVDLFNFDIDVSVFPSGPDHGTLKACFQVVLNNVLIVPETVKVLAGTFNKDMELAGVFSIHKICASMSALREPLCVVTRSINVGRLGNEWGQCGEAGVNYNPAVSECVSRNIEHYTGQWSP